MDAAQEMEPLKITCTSTRCQDNLHCFRLTRQQLREGPAGRCRSCGVQLVDWSRVHRREIGDVKHTIASLKLELIRHHFWHVPLSEYAENYARRKGKAKMPEAVKHRLEKTIGSSFHPMQGRQTPRETSATANVIHYAQHATATCCRACLEEWHGIPADRDLTAEELDYLAELALVYVLEKVPDLDTESHKIRRHRIHGTNRVGVGEPTHAH